MPHMPEGEPWELARLEDGGETLRLCVPETPTQNTWDRWHYRDRGRHREHCLLVLAAEVRPLLGRFDSPWAREATLDVVRCSRGTIPADRLNVWGGLKAAVDCVLLPRPERPGIGLLVDDGPNHLRAGAIEDRPRGHWGDLPGPGTWLWLRRAA